MQVKEHSQFSDEEKDTQIGDSQSMEIDQSIQQIDPEADRYPNCIVWTVLPCISWLLPIIGHTGMCGSDGQTHDFAGPYTIQVDDLAFGKTLKYVKLDKNKMKRGANFDLAIKEADQQYSQEMHNLFCNNCHSHVAYALNKVEYKGYANWTMIGVFWLCIAESTYVSNAAIFKTYIGFIILAIIYFLLF